MSVNKYVIGHSGTIFIGSCEQMWVLRIELRTSERTASALNH